MSQEYDKETQRWNRVEAEAPFKDLQPSVLIRCAEPFVLAWGDNQAGITGLTFSAINEWKGSKRTECATAEETELYPVTIFLRMVLLGGDGQRCGGPRGRPLPATSGHWLCECWAQTGRGEHGERGTRRERKAPRLFSPLRRYCLG